MRGNGCHPFCHTALLPPIVWPNEVKAALCLVELSSTPLSLVHQPAELNERTIWMRGKEDEKTLLYVGSLLIHPLTAQTKEHFCTYTRMCSGCVKTCKNNVHFWPIFNSQNNTGIAYMCFFMQFRHVKLYLSQSNRTIKVFVMVLFAKKEKTNVKHK